MRSLTKRATKAIAAGAALLTLAACNGSFIGSGVMPSDSGRGSAFINMNIKCDTELQQASGSITFKDAGARTMFGNAQITSAFDDLGPFPFAVRSELEAHEEEGEICVDGSEVGAYYGTFSGVVNGRRDSGDLFAFVILNECGEGKHLVGLFLEGRRTGYENVQCLTSGSLRQA